MRRPRVALVSAVAIGCVLAAFVALLATRSSAVDKQARSPLLGKTAPAISGPDLLTGSNVSLAGLHGRFVLINFFASWCIPCQQETPQLAEWTARHAANGSVLAVTFEDTASNARGFLQRSRAGWPVVFDDGPVALDYGVRGPPESYLVDPDGIVLAKFIGGVTADGLDRILSGGRTAS